MKTLRVITLVAFGVFIVAATARVTTADWSPESAARYLDQRQKQWFEWNLRHPPTGRASRAIRG